MATALCGRLGIKIPIIQAPMRGAVSPALAAGPDEASCEHGAKLERTPRTKFGFVAPRPF